MNLSSICLLRRLSLLTALLAAFALLTPACRTATATSSDSSAPDVQGPIASSDAIPEGTDLRVSLNQKLDTVSTQKGDTFTATVLNPLMSETGEVVVPAEATVSDRKSTRLNSSHVRISYAVFCLKKK